MELPLPLQRRISSTSILVLNLKLRILAFCWLHLSVFYLMFQCGRFRSLRMVCSVTAKVSQLYYNTLLGFFLTRLSSMKCTESEDEEPIKGKESQLQLSCFINQEVKYLATGLRLVCIRLLKKKRLNTLWNVLKWRSVSFLPRSCF